ncbi:MAG: methionyl-tRNA formyltransferase [Proteobacteria bacterium]|nr:methionyl-tRNA formyltransferase [Pseudomonadota bacterium]MBI3499672.1 methionyl-tRNA formyltransferase [Pseudomonadota bacterium]
MTTLRLAFMGTPDFAVPILDALLGAGHRVVRVYAQPPRSAGRGQKPRPSPVEAHALALGIPVSTPLSLKDPAEQASFQGLGLDAAVVAAYGLILPKAILEAPRLGCINVHASLLPRWRGAAPIQRALMEGDTETGVTIMQMDQGLDTGPMLLCQKWPIAADATGQSLHDDLARLGQRLIVDALAGLAEGRLQPTAQPRAGATYAGKLARADGRIDWRLAATALERLVRALDPWPGAYFEHGGERIKVLAAETRAGNAAPGTVLDERLTVASGEGAIGLLRLQRPGRQPMPAEALLRGYPIAPGTVLA